MPIILICIETFSLEASQPCLPFLRYQQHRIEPLPCWTVNKDSALFRHVNNDSRSGEVKRNPITWFNSVNTFCVRERSKQEEFPSQTHFKNGPDHGPWIISFKTEKRKQMALGNSFFFFFSHLTTRFSTLRQKNLSTEGAIEEFKQFVIDFSWIFAPFSTFCDRHSSEGFNIKLWCFNFSVSQSFWDWGREFVVLKAISGWTQVTWSRQTDSMSLSLLCFRLEKLKKCLFQIFTILFLYHLTEKVLNRTLNDGFNFSQKVSENKCLGTCVHLIDSVKCQGYTTDRSRLLHVLIIWLHAHP